jgi:response regulator RpfG family c-di-GMP phosphodiesterase
MFNPDSEEKIKVLYVDDERNNLISFKATFRDRYKVVTAISGTEAIERLEEESFHIIITDQRMPNMTGVEFLESILDKYPDPIRLLLTGYADINAVIDAVNKGKIYHYLSKPWDETELDMSIQNAFMTWRKRQDEKEENQKLTTSNDQLEFLLRQKLLT